MPNLKLKAKNSAVLLCISLSTFLLASCSIPNLEKPECTAASQTTKEFYSYHFGNEMKFSRENLNLRARFLTPDLKQKLESQPESATDYFTATDDYPKTFRLGKCKVVEENKKVDFQILLFWKDDERSEQREVTAELVRENDEWLISEIKK